MELTTCEGPRAFLEATLPYRAAEPLRTNVLGSVASTLARNDDGHHARWWVLTEGGEVVGAAMRTPPFQVVLGPMPDEAAALVATAAAASADDLPGVAGYGTGVDAFLAAYRETGSAGGRRGTVETQHQVLYAASEVRVPEVPGGLAVATTDELDAAAAWYAAFAAETDGHHGEPTEAERAALRATISSGRLRWWRDGGQAVSMAAHAEPVATPAGTVTRVGPVYTPPALRGRGYAAAVTGRLTESLLADGSLVMLFADRSNPTSNGVYVRLGYQALDEAVRVTLAAP